MNLPVGSEWWRAESQTDGGDDCRSSAAAAAEATASSVPFWFLLAFTFILLLAPQQVVPALAPYRIALLTAAVAVITYVYDRLSRRQPIVHLEQEIWITLCLIGWALMTLPFSYWPGGSLSFLVGAYLKTLVIFWLLSNAVNTLTRLRLVTWGLSLMAIPLALTAVAHFVSGVFLPEGPASETKRIVGYDAPLTENPNDLALMLNLVLPLCIALLLDSPRPLIRALLLAMIGLDVTAVILTFSRAGFLTLVTIIVMYMWKLRKRPEGGMAVAALVIALVCLPLLPSGYFDRLSTITNIESDSTGSSQVRWRDTLAAVNFVVQNPIVGAGVGMNVLALNEERGPYWLNVHNVYLQYAVDLGIPGLVLFLILLVTCIKSASRVRQCSAPVPAFRELFYLAEGIQVSLIAFAVAAAFHPVAYHFYFYYMAGLAVAVKVVHETVKSAHDQNQSLVPLRKQL
jgi:probable O-glycosylation ligase (exosortase A-associated)